MLSEQIYLSTSSPNNFFFAISSFLIIEIADEVTHATEFILPCYFTSIPIKLSREPKSEKLARTIVAVNSDDDDEVEVEKKNEKMSEIICGFHKTVASRHKSIKLILNGCSEAHNNGRCRRTVVASSFF